MNWELSFLHVLQNVNNPLLDVLMAGLSTLGNAGAFWILLGFVLLISKRYRQVGLQMLIAMMITFIVGNLLLKNMVHRPRPYVIDSTLLPRVRKPNEYSFPSGHTMNGITAAVTLLLSEKHMGIPAMILALGIAFSRMYNLVHFPTDIIGGIVIGVSSALAVQWYMNRKKSNSVL